MINRLTRTNRRKGFIQQEVEPSILVYASDQLNVSVASDVALVDIPDLNRERAPARHL